MKNLSKLIAVAFVASALFFTTTAKAQTSGNNDLRFGIGLETGIPTGVENDKSSFEVGGTARLQYGTSANFAWTLTSGFYDFVGKSNPNFTDGTDYASLHILPVKIGIKDFFSQNVYFGLEGGAGFILNNGNVKIIGAPALGYASKTWDVGVRYENYFGTTNYGLVGLRIAYAFPLSSKK